MSDLRFVEKQKPSIVIIAICFALTAVAMAVVTQLIVGGIGVFFGAINSVFELFIPAVAVTLTSWGAMYVGTRVRAAEIRSGGAVVARRLGAVQASTRSRHQSEQSLMRLVSTLAIEAHSKRPNVFVLRDELSINSLTVGSLSGDYAIIVTQGALDTLSEDELGAIIAHEYAHIAHGDVPSNMRLMNALAGLLFVDQMGRRLAEKASTKPTVHPYNLVGFVLRSWGFVGFLSASLLRLSYSKRSELEADNKATQIVRQGLPLSNSLNKIKQADSCNVALHAYYVDEVKHLCVHSGNRSSRWAKIYSAHPSIDRRLSAIESALESNDNRTTSFSSSTSVYSWSMGSVDTDATLSERGVFMMPDVESSLAALFALFLPPDEPVRSRYLSSIAFAYNQNFSNLVANLTRDMPQELAVERLGVLHLATRKIVGKLKPMDCRHLVLNLERLLKSHGLNSLMNYAALQHLRSRLSVDFPVLQRMHSNATPDAAKRLLKPVENMGEEIALLLSLVLEMTTLSTEEIEREYSRILGCYTETDFVRRTAKESDIGAEVEAAYQLMLMQPRAVRASFVEHCREIGVSDQRASAECSSALQVFSASLGCTLRMENNVVEPLLSRSA